MDIWVAIWRNYNEFPYFFVEGTNRVANLVFETILPGGFGVCSFTVDAAGWQALRWYRGYIGFHVVLLDAWGRRLYEGRIESVDASNQGIDVRVEGYYAHGTDLTHGILYPMSTPTSISDIIEDTVLIADQWSHDLSMIKKTVTDVTPKDYTGENKLLDAIEDVLKTGDDGVLPVPLHFAIWDNRRAHLFAEPQLTTLPNWWVYSKDFVDVDGLAISRTRKDLYNKIQVLFDDPEVGKRFTDWYEDKNSQALFGVREGSINIGASVLDIANLVAQLAINTYAKPTQSSRLGISGRVYTASGVPDFPYMVRAGTLLQVNDFDPTVSQLNDGEGGMDSSIVFVSRTQYKADTNTLEVELGRANVALDILMARLGMSSGSVK